MQNTIGHVLHTERGFVRPVMFHNFSLPDRKLFEGKKKSEKETELNGGSAFAKALSELQH
jgi:hypothetical protein